MPWSLTLKNDVGRALTPYPIDPGPPPQRVADPAGLVDAGDTAAIDVAGFNPVYIYAPLPQAPDQPNGFIIQMDLSSGDPMILVVSFLYRVAPGQEGADPALQPVKVSQFPFTGLVEGDYVLTAEAGRLSFSLGKATQSDGSGCGSGILLLSMSLAADWVLGR